jgi:DNA-binding NtrC family response regulator
MNILLAEDDDATRKGIALFLRSSGHTVTAANDGQAALDAISANAPDLVISDIRMPALDGLAMLSRLRERGCAAPVLMMTAYATIEEAVKALQAGAIDYLTKPLNLDELAVRIQRIETELSLARENRQLRDRLHSVEFPGMVGQAKAMSDLRRSIRLVAGDGNVPVMIYGESGTGKEMAARTIHTQSSRARFPFVDVSCAAFSDELLESELFGHRRGAFTGAYRDKEGIVQAAHLGTLFLDEVSEMSPRMQSKLLRFLQEHTVMPVGSTAAVGVDVRVIGASNRDLHDLVREGSFREDLYYRLNVFELRMPPLRARIEDIAALVAHFTAKHGAARPRPLRFSRACWDVLDHHGWPGNVRELENLIRVLLVACDKDEAGVEDLPVRMLSPQPAGGSAVASSEDYETTIHAAMAGFEERFLRARLSRHEHNVSRTAAAIGLSRVSLYKKIKQYGIDL